ncbi:MAG: hypothetical protein ACK56I_23430, partial [bacterium]
LGIQLGGQVVVLLVVLIDLLRLVQVHTATVDVEGRKILEQLLLLGSPLVSGGFLGGAGFGPSFFGNFEQLPLKHLRDNSIQNLGPLLIESLFFLVNFGRLGEVLVVPQRDQPGCGIAPVRHIEGGLKNGPHPVI